MEIIRYINFAIALIFFACYSYQYLYMLIPLFNRRKDEEPLGLQRCLHRYAVLIAARDEEPVIAQLIDSIKLQDYPQELLDIYVVADNCTDGTACIARLHGAQVYERYDRVKIGKGYALNWLLQQIHSSGEYDCYDAFFVFDADNLLESDYISRMNNTFSQGYDIVTGCRSSKNFGDNWLSAGYGIWFLRQSAFINHSRMLLGTGCAVSGTGFMFSRQLLDACGGWNFFLLTEDLEFTIHTTLMGARSGYCPDAVFYDEQPTRLSQSWRQRLRWSRGYIQVFCRYWRQLLRGIFHLRSFTCFDMAMSVAPAVLLTAVSVLLNAAGFVVLAVTGGPVIDLCISWLRGFVLFWANIYAMGLLTVAVQWKRIHCSVFRKIAAPFAFPVYVLLSVPIGAATLFVDVCWHPIEHNCTYTIAETVNHFKSAL